MNAADHVFGVDHLIHPVTKRPLETGRGALPPDQQAMAHIEIIRAEEGDKAAKRVSAALRKHMHPDPVIVETKGETDA